MRQIIVLETRKGGDGVSVVNGFFWFPISNVNARVPRPGFISAGSSLTGAAAITPAEQAALEDGSVREENFAVNFAASTTVAQVKADLVRRYTDRAASVAAEPPTRAFYGLSYDGTSWSA